MGSLAKVFTRKLVKTCQWTIQWQCYKNIWDFPVTFKLLLTWILLLTFTVLRTEVSAHLMNSISQSPPPVPSTATSNHAPLHLTPSRLVPRSLEFCNRQHQPTLRSVFLHFCVHGDHLCGTWCRIYSRLLLQFGYGMSVPLKGSFVGNSVHRVVVLGGGSTFKRWA